MEQYSHDELKQIIKDYSHCRDMADLILNSKSRFNIIVLQIKTYHVTQHGVGFFM